MLANELQELGLDKKEAECYLANLKLGSVQNTLVANEVGLARSTSHFVLQELVKKGLVTSEKRGNAFFFTAEKPEKIRLMIERKGNEVERQLNVVDSIMSELKQMESPHAELPQVRYFSGIDGITEMVHVMGAENRGQDLVAFAAGDYFSEQYPGWVNDIRTFVNRNYASLYSIRDPKYKELYPEKSSNIRYYTDPDLAPTVNFQISGDAIGIASIDQKKPIAILINNKDIADNFRKLFSVVWEDSKP